MVENKNPSVLAAMAGVTDGAFAQKFLVEGEAGLVTLGGYPVGKDMIRASNQIMARGRKEFEVIAGEEVQKIITEINKIAIPKRVILNLRISSSDDAIYIANGLINQIGSDIIIEINAHCRQHEVIEYGGGEALLLRTSTLKEIIDIFKSSDFRTSLKIRGNKVIPNLFIDQIKKIDLDFLHIDSYRTGLIGTDLDLLTYFSQNLSIPIIGNNSITDFRSAHNVLRTGAKYFSIARAAKKNLLIFKSILKHI